MRGKQPSELMWRSVQDAGVVVFCGLTVGIIGTGTMSAVSAASDIVFSRIASATAALSFVVLILSLLLRCAAVPLMRLAIPRLTPQWSRVWLRYPSLRRSADRARRLGRRVSSVAPLALVPIVVAVGVAQHPYQWLLLAAIAAPLALFTASVWLFVTVAERREAREASDAR